MRTHLIYNGNIKGCNININIFQTTVLKVKRRMISSKILVS